MIIARSGSRVQIESRVDAEQTVGELWWSLTNNIDESHVGLCSSIDRL